MNSLTRRVKSEYLWLTTLRLLILGGALLIVSIYIERIGRPSYPLIYLFLLAILSSYIFYLILRGNISLRTVVYMVLSLDVLLETFIVYYTGGIQSDFTFLYFFTIVLASVFLLLKGSLFMAFLSAFLYGLTVYLEKAHVLPPNPFAALQMEGGMVLLKLYLNILFFFLVAVLSAYIAERMVSHGKELEITRKILKQVKLDTTAIIENIPSGLIAIDIWGNILYFNKAGRRILGLEGRVDFGELERNVPEFAEELKAILKGKRDHKRREIKLRNGVPLGLSHAYLYDENGEKRGAVVVFQDLTEYKEMEWELRRLDRLAAVGEFSAHLAHEIRNPLTAIRGSIEVLKDMTKNSGEASSLMDLVLEESDRLNRIVTDFLQFARIPAPSVGRFDVVSLIRKVVKKGRNFLVQGKDIDIEEEYGASEFMIEGDENQMEQVLVNLIKNAIDAIEKRGRVKVRFLKPGSIWRKLNGSTAEVPEDMIAIQVEDNGRGIPREKVDSIFEPFFTTKKGGTGLGLCVVQRIVSNHGGVVKVDSVEGRGTIFTLYLPIRRGS